MSEWFETLDGIQTRVWQTLEAGVANRLHVARTPTFATVRDGFPEARSVVLRAVDIHARSMDIHTDLGSAKVRSLQQTPRAALHIWDQSQSLQIRIATDVTILTGDDVAAIWQNVPDPAREVYGTSPSPGTVITDPFAYSKPADQSAFVVLRCKVSHIDALYLGDQHRRAAYAQSRDWSGEWLAP